MDGNQMGTYLRARRQMVHPEDVGRPSEPGRRVAGLRREEVAELAGISPDYYLRLEQGRDAHPSDQVLRALSKALLLDDDSAAYLQRLVNPVPSAAFAPRSDSVDWTAFELLEGWTHTVAYVTNGCQDVVAANAKAISLAPMLYTPGINLLLALFTDDMKMAVPTWDDLIRGVLASMRARTDPSDPRLHEIVGELSLRDADFRRLWALHEVRNIPDGSAPVFIEGFGIVEMHWQNLIIPADPRLVLVSHFGMPGSIAEEALRSL
jgi:transcriptional regulator with XRE-family HTH domain